MPEKEVLEINQFLGRVIMGDCIEVLKSISDNYIDAIITDPPYEIGFMGKKWDSTGIAYNVKLWKECLRVLKPGGHILAFGGTRTYHRMASAIEDAGFEIRDMIEWVYGSGFPKSLNIGKAVDKLQGNERVFVCKNPANRPYNLTKGETSTGWKAPIRPDKDKGTSEWEGWGTALKPAHEPICMARKPLAEKTVAQNVLKYGTGGINIDESRVEGKLEGDPNRFAKTDGGSFNKFSYAEPVVRNEGRFPANLIHDNSEEVRECFPETNKQAKCKTDNKSGWQTQLVGGKVKNPIERKLYLDDDNGGNASRFFKSIIYQAKSSKSDRNSNGAVKNIHPTCKPTKLMEYLIKMVTPKG